MSREVPELRSDRSSWGANLGEVPKALRDSLSDRYRIDRELGRGGMATVYLAHDLKHHRLVAIKVLPPELSVALGAERFLREIDFAARLTHPHILPLHDSGEAAGQLYYVMPYVEGESLRQRLMRQRQLTFEEVVRVTREVADALDYAHEHGVIHRDIKPENVLLAANHAIVADFGIARAVGTEGGTRLTAAGVTVGTPHYMSPEQSLADQEVDARSDVYSLGCMTYEMLTGQPPFTGPSAAVVRHQHLNVEPRPVTALRPSATPQMVRAVARALAKLPADRFATPGELARALGEIDGSASGVRAPTSTSADTVTVGAPRRRAWLAPALLLASLGVGGFLAVKAGWIDGLWGGDRGAPAARQNWVMVAEFDGPPDDSTLAEAARDIVSATLDQSPILATVSRDQIRLGLELAGKPAGTRVDATLARELAYRTSVRTVVDGRIRRVGKAYSLMLDVGDVENAKPLYRVSGVAGSDRVIIPALRRLAQDLRRRMGEDEAAIRATRAFFPYPTPSFEAYRKQVEADRLLQVEVDFQGVREAARQALAIDPDFASAWEDLALAYQGLGKPDSARAALEQALRRPDRMSAAQQLRLEGLLASWSGDLERAAAVFERVVKLYPQSPDIEYVVDSQANLLFFQGRYSEALEMNNRVLSMAPLGYGQVTIAKIFRCHLALGNTRAARELLGGMRGEARQVADLQLAVAERDWGRAESLATARERDPTTPTGVKIAASSTLAAVHAARGAVRDAMADLRRGQSLARRSGREYYRRWPRARTFLAVASGTPAPVPESEDALDATSSALITRAYMAAAAGDTLQSKQLLRALRSHPDLLMPAYGATPDFLEACIAGRAGRWNDVIRLLDSTARTGSDVGGTGFDRVGPAPEQWLVAEAYEHLGRPDSSAAFFERVLSPASMVQSPTTAGLSVASSFARQRLILLYARMGRTDEVRRHWEIFRDTFTRPDAEVRHLVDEARAALAIGNPKSGVAVH